jgi:endonuclease/exonuclease/phosphatase family metal-dependent hydrolase
MRWLIILLCTLHSSAGDPVTILTWNLKWFPGGGKTSSPVERVVHMSAAKDALLELSPDVLCVQELRNWESLEELASIKPRMLPNVVSSYRDSPEGGALSIQQVGIASRLTAIGAWGEAFRLAENSPPRGFAFIALELKCGRRLLVYSVHFKSNRGDLISNIARREEGARQLVTHVKQMELAYKPIAATIVCGDFNTDPTDARFSQERTFDIFREAGFRWPWDGRPLASRVTLPASGSFPDACFDGFLVKGDMRVKSCKVKTIDGVSDHRPVELVVE